MRDENISQAKFSLRAIGFYLFWRRPGGEPIVDLFNRGFGCPGARSWSRPEMAPQRLERIESAPGNGMGPGASNPQDLVHGRADRALLRLTSRENEKLQKKAPKALQSLDAELKSALAFPTSNAIRDF